MPPVQPRSDHDQTPGEVHEVLHAINGTVLPIASVAPDISAIRRHVKSIESSVQLMEKYL